MRIGNIHLLLFVLLAFPGRAPAKQDAAASGNKTEIKNGTITAPAPVKENWGALNDLKTGLQPRVSFIVQRDEQPEYVRELVRVQWRALDPIDLWVIRPKVTGKVPVVLYLYGHNDTNDRFHDNGWCKRATADGFAAVGFVSALTDYRYKFRSLKQGFISELSESLGTTVHDVQLILNYVADRGDMDMNNVGMFGMGSGATIAILAAQADSRIKTLDLLDPWGDWPDWIKGSPLLPEDQRSKYLTPEFLKSVAALDPITYLPYLRTQNIRLQQMFSEPATPQIAKERIAATVPERTQIARYRNQEDLLKSWQTMGLSGWIKQQMRPQAPNRNREDAGVALSHNSK